MDKCFTPIMDAISQIDYETSKDISIVFLALMVFDFAVNSFKMFKNKSFNQTWKIDFKHSDEEEEVTT